MNEVFSDKLFMFFHISGTGGQQKSPVACAKGHFCPKGTVVANQHPCPAGSWTNQTNLRDASECYACPKGWFCLQGSATPTDLCFTGHWCPVGRFIVNIFIIFLKSDRPKYRITIFF